MLPALLANPSNVPKWRWEYDQKLLLLLDHFKIPRTDPDCWRKLALCLAVVHVPGFQVAIRRKSGRPRKMTRQEEQSLYQRYLALQRGGHSARNAARLMVKELRDSCRMNVKEGALLRRMQRYDKTAKQVSSLFQRLLKPTQIAGN
jgi:hypothetical protein